MYCVKCGNKLMGNEAYCIKCGEKVNNNLVTDEVKVNNVVKEEENVTKNNSGKKVASIVLGILSLVGAFLVIFAPLALIFSIIGLILAIIANKKENNVIGIILNSVGMFISVFISILLFLILNYVINTTHDIFANYVSNLWDEDSYIKDYYNQNDFNF